MECGNHFRSSNIAERNKILEASNPVSILWSENTYLCKNTSVEGI